MPLHMAEYSIGLDLGGTNLRAAAIDRSGRMLEKISGTTNFSEGKDALLSDIVAEISKLREKHGLAGLAGIGVGVPGFIRMKEGVITNSNNLPFLENVPVRDEISRRLGTRVILENDANAAALGEKWIGAGRDADDLVLLTLGTGIGGGIIYGGRIVRGFVGMAGEFGHMTVVPNGNPCGCGNQGCLENTPGGETKSARNHPRLRRPPSRQGCAKHSHRYHIPKTPSRATRFKRSGSCLRLFACDRFPKPVQYELPIESKCRSTGSSGAPKAVAGCNSKVCECAAPTPRNWHDFGAQVLSMWQPENPAGSRRREFLCVRCV